MMARPKPETYRFDLDAALSSVIGVQAQIPPDAFTASILGTDRAGNGVLIGTEGVVLTIGYLVTEADTVWLKAADGRAINGHVLAYDQETGFGLVQALGDLHAPVMALGQSAEAQVGDPVIIAGYGGRKAALEARIVAKQEFAGYWEYLLDEAFFTAPAHPDWGGAAVIGADGTLLGVGSLTVQQGGQQGGEQAGFGTEPQSLNMAVPIDLLKPILNDLMTRGRRRPPPRPWLGLYATEIDDRVVIAGLAATGPARRARLKVGDVVLAVRGQEVGDLAGLFRKVWACGEAGTEIPMTVSRGGERIDTLVRSADRMSFLKRPSLH